MKKNVKSVVYLFAWIITSVLIGQIHPAFGAIASWSDWTSASSGNPGSANGMIVLPNLTTVSINYIGEISFAQTSGGINYWAPPTAYISPTVENPPPANDIIALIGGNVTVNMITFSEPVVNPVMAIVGLGRTGVPVRYQFDAPFVILSNGPGFGGNGPLTELPGNVLEGKEGHGTIQFPGSYTSISWTVPNAENWHGFTIGIPTCVSSIDIILNGSSFTTGDNLTAQAHVTNLCDEVEAEAKLWVELPDGFMISLFDPHLTLTLAPSDDFTAEILNYTFNGTEPSGSYEIGGRFLNPLNGDHLSTDIETLEFTP